MGTDSLLDSPTIDHPIIFFDGVCNLCNSSVQFIIRNDKKGYFHFASLQSDEAEKILKGFDVDSANSESIVLLKEGKIYQRSEAALEIARDLDGIWKSLAVFKVFPVKFRDWIYNWIARNRYNWFGRKDECMIPQPGIKARFLHS